MDEFIKIKGARAHNLKNINVNIPRNKLVIITGVSGSGKSSLAFDTLYAEGHRRFVESLSSYARMFMGQVDKPDVDSIEGLSPSISIDQKTTSRNPRSTVGTVTEIYDYLRLLYARVGIPHCPICGKEIKQQTTDQIIEQVLNLPSNTKLLILAPVVKAKKGTQQKVLEDIKRNGYVRVRVDNYIYDLSEDIELDKNIKHSIEIVIDRLIIKDGIRTRLADSIENALKEAKGNVEVAILDGNECKEVLQFSQNYACYEHGISLGEISPRMFSYNNPLGACPSCSGLGETNYISFDKICDTSKSLRGGCFHVNGFKTIDDGTWFGPILIEVGKKYGFDLDMPIEQYSPKALDVLKNGTGDEIYEVTHSNWSDGYPHHFKFEGIIKKLQQRYEQFHDQYYEEFCESQNCLECNGSRLKKEILCVTVGGKNIDEFCRMSISEAIDFVDNIEFTENEKIISKEIIKVLKNRLMFLKNVGLDYLTLSQKAGTLSGGEAQRIRLATQIGSALVGVTYVLDEPSIGLHQRDNNKLISALKNLRDVGNSVIVVEHDEDTMLASDYIIDIGPGAGVHGGEIVAEGKPSDFINNEKSITAQFLSKRKSIDLPKIRRPGNGNYLRIFGACENNLKNINVSIPLGCFVCVTGVSGSGKSSLVNEIIYKNLARQLNRAYTVPGKCKKIDGLEYLDKVINIDQSPIGRMPTSNPATYTGLFNDIRELFAKTQDAKIRGYTASRFSFNIRGGRCENCEGNGVKKIEMNFLPDVYVTCEACQGKRYNEDTLSCKYKDKNIYEVLEMTVQEGISFFSNIPKIYKRLKTIDDIGLGYIKIGQSSTTLSGGEAQRVKLATELSKRSTGKTLFILDEPTTGLHMSDVKILLIALQKLVDAGNTVLVIEHNMDVIKSADYIIDLGPEGGVHGGELLISGTPEEVADCEKSFTGNYLKKVL